MDTSYCLHPVITKRGFWFPCGQCPVCRMKIRKQIAVRLYMEKSIEKPDYSYFITLTYNDNAIPTCSGRHCFSKKDIQTFFDSCKHKLYKYGYRQRYFVTCEYGDEGYRPHYHFIVFLYRHGNSRAVRFARHQYLHDIVEPLWNRGFCYDGNVSLTSIMYCTAYALKDDEALERDWRGFEEGRPFRLFSLRPGLGLTPNCINWWTDYAFNDGEARSGITIHLPKRSVSSGIPSGVKRRIRETYPDIYEILKEFNKTAYQDSVPRLIQNANKFGSTCYIDGVRRTDGNDFTPDKQITAFRKACRELAKRQRNPLK